MTALSRLFGTTAMPPHPPMMTVWMPAHVAVSSTSTASVVFIADRAPVSELARSFSALVGRQPGAQPDAHTIAAVAVPVPFAALDEDADLRGSDVNMGCGPEHVPAAVDDARRQRPRSRCR